MRSDCPTGTVAELVERSELAIASKFTQSAVCQILDVEHLLPGQDLAHNVEDGLVWPSLDMHLAMPSQDDAPYLHLPVASAARLLFQ